VVRSTVQQRATRGQAPRWRRPQLAWLRHLRYASYAQGTLDQQALQSQALGLQLQHRHLLPAQRGLLLRQLSEDILESRLPGH
jgi:hypothetical protein